MQCKYVLITNVLLFLNVFSFSQSQKTLTWDELRDEYEFPQWYKEARFGIWVHWGAQSQPEVGGGWYARHMYMSDVGDEKWGEKAYNYHLNTYGHPSEKGFKDVIHAWKAERLDADSLVQFFKNVGAKYFVALANHHDHFDNFQSTYHPWNSVNVGPKKDIIREFEQAAKKNNIPFGVSSHDDRFLNWWLPAFSKDKTGPFKDIPYDGYKTLEDGKGTWWEGLNPADLYGLPPEQRTQQYIETIKTNWKKRHTELITNYDIDYLWFDGYGFPYNDKGRDVSTTFLNNDFADGEFNKVIVGKFQNEPSTVKDIERGGANDILPYPWQSIITFNDWFYKKDEEFRHNPRSVIEMLVDVVSKNGNLLLNVEIKPDGTLPPILREYLTEIGNWLQINQEAIYESRPWIKYGDNLHLYTTNEEGLTLITDLQTLNEHKDHTHFNERTITSPPYEHNEVRYTTNNGYIYVFVMNPTEGKVVIPSLGRNSLKERNCIQSIVLLGSKEPIIFKQKKRGLDLYVPRQRPTDYVSVFKVIRWR